MSHVLKLSIPVFLLLGLAACQDSGTEDAIALSDSVSPAVSSSVALFDKEMDKKGCELLTAEMVSKTFDVPADSLRQMKIMGCRYDWNNETETVETGISMIQVHKTEASAKSWFETATRNKTAEEMAAEMKQVSEQMDQSEQLDSDLKKSTAKGLLALVDSDAVQFEDVAGVGNEARVSGDGTVYVRQNNLTFMVSAYKGPVAPPMDMQGVDLKQMVNLAKEHSKQWATQTAPQRKKDGALLARAIVDGL